MLEGVLSSDRHPTRSARGYGFRVKWLVAFWFRVPGPTESRSSNRKDDIFNWQCIVDNSWMLLDGMPSPGSAGISPKQKVQPSAVPSADNKADIVAPEIRSSAVAQECEGSAGQGKGLDVSQCLVHLWHREA